MAEVTSEQIQALTDAVTGLSEKVGSMPKGGSGQSGDFTSQLKENAKGAIRIALLALRPCYVGYKIQ